MARLLVVDDEIAVRKALERYLTRLGHEVLTAADGEEGLSRVKGGAIDLALVDLVMPKIDGIEFITSLKREQPDAVAIILTGYGTISSAVEAMKAGAYHYLTKPFELDDISAIINNALEHRLLKIENTELKRQLRQTCRFENIVGNSEAMRSVFEMVDCVAPTDSTVLILGESGTGKELIAKAIHYASLRKEKPLVIVNCAAIPEGLLESELFGHVRGSFTGAIANKSGRFDAANGGTIFLDEIGDMSLGLQVKLLRVLQDQRFEPVGSTKSHSVDVRIIAATNQDLEKAVEERRFREDLFYRLNAIPIYIPPLRERKGDVPMLLDYFLHRINSSNSLNVGGFSEPAMDALSEYAWPGNVRELENMVERLVVLKRNGLVDMVDLPKDVKGKSQIDSLAGGETEVLPDDGISFKTAVDEFESNLIRQALERTGGNKNKAASLLGLNRTTLVEKIKKKGIDSV